MKTIPENYFTEAEHKGTLVEKEIDVRMRKHIVTLHPVEEHHGYRSWMQDQIKKSKKESQAGKK